MVTVYNHANSTPAGPIAGSTVGGLAVIFASGLLWYCCRRATGTDTVGELPDDQIPADDVAAAAAAATQGSEVGMSLIGLQISSTNHHWSGISADINSFLKVHS